MQHQGPRTAGNKSLLTFRSDTGIPGCTCYTPGSCSVPIPIKPFAHTGRLAPEAALRAAAEQEAGQRAAASEYCSSYQADPLAYQPRSGSAGGAWFAERQRAAAGSSPPFLGESSYASQLVHGRETAAQQLQQSQGVPSTLVAYQVARERRQALLVNKNRDQKTPAAACQPPSQMLRHPGSVFSCTSSPISPLCRPQSELSRTTGGTAAAPLGYRTTYSSNTALIAEAAAAARAAMAQRPTSCCGAERLRLAVMPSSNGPVFDGSTTYSRDFGTAGSDPMLRFAGSCSGMTATTSALNQGTTRTSSGHPPGYTGFIPAAAANMAAVQQGSGATAKQDIKAAMLPSTLDQYSRGRLAHYTGYKPQAGPGATAVHRFPTTETTQGFANQVVARASATMAKLLHSDLL